MTRRGKWVVVWLGILLVAPALFAQSPSPRRDRRLLRRHPQQREVVLPTQPSGPLTQVSLDQLPAAPPRVSYQNGSLTIVAENSTLGDILREVHKATGASIDVPANANERVIARLGPAPARDVLASLLNGSSFNYVLVGSVTDPAALSSVMLTAKSGGGIIPAPTQTAEVYQPPPVRTALIPPPAVAPAAAATDDNADDSEDAEEDKDDEQPAAGQPGQADPNNAASPPDASQPNAGPKNPQQIMEMLRKSVQSQQPQTNVPQDPPD